VLVRAVPELRAQRSPVFGRHRPKAVHVPNEFEVLHAPLVDRRQSRTERHVDRVVAIADEDRAVAHARMAVDVLDHLLKRKASASAARSRACSAA